MLCDHAIFKTFIYKGGFYLYDTYSNCLMKISNKHFEELAVLSKIGISQYKHLHKNTDEYNDVILLMKKGMLKANEIKSIMHPNTSNIEEMLPPLCCAVLFLDLSYSESFARLSVRLILW